MAIIITDNLVLIATLKIFNYRGCSREYFILLKMDFSQGYTVETTRNELIMADQTRTRDLVPR